MLNSRLTSIMKELMAADTAVTSEFLANIIQVTSRTVRNDIKELEAIISKHGASIKSVRGTGYELIIHDDLLFKKFLQDVFQDQSSEQGFIPTLPEDRVSYLIRRLLLIDNYIKLEDLADELYISKSTVQNDLKDVRKILEPYGIILEKRPNYGLKLKGDEVKLRFCMSEYLFNRSGAERLNERLAILPKNEMDIIRSIILEQIKEHEITLSDIGLNNLIIHIAIACVRIRNENYVSIYPDELDNILKQKEYEVAMEIVSKLEGVLDVLFPQTEVAYIAIHLLGTKIVVHPNISEKEIQTLIDKDIYNLIDKILETIDTKLKLGIRHDKELIVGMGLHLKPAINRYRYSMNLRNPMLDAIKSNYPMAFEAGILAGIVLKEEIGIDINENEIGYLALHLGAAMERNKMNKQVKRCIIVCASGIGSASLLNYKLKSEFGSKLEIVGTTEYYKLNEVPFDTIDFVVSTIPIKEILPVPVIEVNTILGGTDLEKIENVINDRADQTFEYLTEDLVFLQQKFETRDEVLAFLVKKLEKKGLVDHTFLEAVYDREALSPTGFGNFVAIPHPITPKTDTTFWAICTLQKPIDWGGKRVQFICLLCVEKDSSTDFKKMYELLLNVVDSEKLVQQLIKCESYSEFINLFLKQSK